MERANKKKTSDKKKSSQESPAVQKEQFNEHINNLVAPHIESMSWAYDVGIQRAIDDIPEMRLNIDDKDIRVSWGDIHIDKPSLETMTTYPAECRQSGVSYSGVTTIKAKISVDNKDAIHSVELGRIPIMVKSSKCHLYKATTEQLVRHHEEPQEGGGYFISNGGERLLRMLISYRANYLQAAERTSFNRVGHGFGSYGLVYRSLLSDGTSRTQTFHYSNNGAITLRFYIDKNELLLPVIFLLKMLADTNDREIFNRVIECDPSKTYLFDGAEILLREANISQQFLTKEQVVAHFGSSMRQPMESRDGPMPYLSDLEIGRRVLNRYIFPNLQTDIEKFDIVILAIQKLLFVVHGDASLEGSDYADSHEILTPGQMIIAIIKERLERTLNSAKILLKREALKSEIDDQAVKRSLKGAASVGARLHNFIATGNLVSESGLDMGQTAGFTVVAEKINLMRFLGHFRSVHRGAFFATLRTSDVRKLRPEGWGFFCPVHTPDGAPCGLLNHLTTTCKVVSEEANSSQVAVVMASMGMIPIRNFIPSKDHNKAIHITVMLDGSVIGKVAVEKAQMIVDHLRHLKCEQVLPEGLEVVYTPPENGGKFPGITMFSTPNRMIRPVRNLKTGKTEYIGTAEQVYLNVAVNDQEIRDGVSTHVELDVTNLLSVVADLTPFSDYNQSPRNMYQCQMAKQTLGSAFHSYPYRNDNKIFRLQTPQAPMVQNRMQKVYGANDLPSGTNAVVAVISYTGYDMEDAMIINKSSYERGFKHASVYKTYEVDLEGDGMMSRRAKGSNWFTNINPEDPSKVIEDNSLELDLDGLPLVGTKMEKGKVFYSHWDDEKKTLRKEIWKGDEEAYIDEVLVLGRSKSKPNGIPSVTNATIKVRFNRNPVIGDKFASRAGQKGILSQLWPQVDMPFSESGISPDIIINPHAFPSRMTIGMLIESMAGKSGSLHGMYQDSTPFQFDEKDKAIDYFGEQLIKAGYNYHGNEPMYSGIYGTEFRVDIFIGVVYYQRLRHMVKDKYQVRSTGPISPLTHQPVKGRKKGGGIRFGEMERDSILAHGTPHLLHDRLMLSSDAAKAAVCTSCGSLLTPHFSSLVDISCRVCETTKSIETVEIPYVFKYLATELASANIKMTLSTN